MKTPPSAVMPQPIPRAEFDRVATSEEELNRRRQFGPEYNRISDEADKVPKEDFERERLVWFRLKLMAIIADAKFTAVSKI
jgi:hypothetical protein